MAKRFALVAIVLLAVGLRFYRLDDQSFWNDEGNSARLSERSVQLIIEGTASDIHPPFYYLCLRAWREIAGEHEFGLRSLSAFVGVGTVAVTIALARVVAGRNSAYAKIIAGLFAAVSPPLVYYSQETRMYGLLALLGAFSTWLLVVWLRNSGSVWLAIGYVITAALGLYTHYFFPAILLVQSLLVAASALRVPSMPRARTGEGHGWLPWHVKAAWTTTLQPLVRWLGLMVVVLLLYLPWLPIFLRQASNRNVAGAHWTQFAADIGRWIFYGSTIENAGNDWPMAAAGLLVIAGVVAGGVRSILPLVGVSIPVALMLVAGTTGPQFQKFMLIAVPFLAVLIGNGWSEASRSKGWIRWLPLAPLVTFIWFGAGSLRNMYFDPAYERADYRGMAARIESEGLENAGILLSAPNQWEVFTYYHRDGAPVYPIPMGRPTEQQIADELAQIAGQHDLLYAIFWGELQQDPNGIVEQWLDEHTFRATDEWIGDVRFVTYATGTDAGVEMETPLYVPFGDQIMLDGFSLRDATLSRSELLRLTLFWQAASPINQRYKIFLHLIDGNGRMLTQQDTEPVGGSLPTTGWIPDQTVIDNHALLIPDDAAAGEYRLLLGVYEFTDPTARLLAETDIGTVDAITLAMIVVE